MFLTFLGAVAALALLLLSSAAAAAFRRWILAKLAAGAAILGASLYAAGLLALSLHSEDTTLALGDRKYFCEVDCHLAYSVENVRVAPADSGNRWLVTLRVWFDPNTISAFRGDAPLGPNPRIAWVLDELGTRHEIPACALAPVEIPLRPGESVETCLRIRLPAAVRRPRLFVGDAPGLERLVPGHENSPGHAKIYFALTPGWAALAPPSHSGRPQGPPLLARTIPAELVTAFAARGVSRGNRGRSLARRERRRSEGSRRTIEALWPVVRRCASARPRRRLPASAGSRASRSDG
jgi:hypothetical protein